MMDSGEVFDVAVIGAGATGRTAAVAAAKAGGRVALLDERAIDLAGLPDGIQAMAGTQAWGLFRGGEIGIIHDGTTEVIRACTVIIATGARDVLAPFSGWTLAGVFARDDACRLLTSGDFPHTRVVVVAADPTPELDALLTDAGSAVVARVSSDQFPTFSASGNETVSAISSDGDEVAADAVVMAAGRQPDDMVARMVSAVSLWRPELGGDVPLRDELLRVNGSWCWVTGDATGLLADPETGNEEAALVGECAALVARDEPTDDIAARIAAFRSVHPERVPMRAESRADDPLSAWLQGITDRTVICRCEGVTAGPIRAAIDAGMRSINDVKRRTRAGMGSCQGAWCTRTIGTMLADAAVPELDPAPMTSRPPARLVTVGQLARLNGV